MEIIKNYEIAKYILLLTSESFIIGLIIIGYFSKYKDIFARATILLLFTIVLNTYLKSVFKVPLNQSIGKDGWAFPSGHMQSFLVFYGYIVWQLSNKYISIIFIVLSHLVGYSLIYLNYHNFSDILGAFYFGLITLVSYQYINFHIFDNSYQKRIGLIIALISFLISFYIPKYYEHVSAARSALLGFSIGWAFTKPTLPKNFAYVISIIYGVLGCLAIFYSSYYIPSDLSNFSIAKYFLTGIWISYGVGWFSGK